MRCGKQSLRGWGGYSGLERRVAGMASIKRDGRRFSNSFEEHAGNNGVATRQATYSGRTEASGTRTFYLTTSSTKCMCQTTA